VRITYFTIKRNKGCSHQANDMMAADLPRRGINEPGPIMGALHPPFIGHSEYWLFFGDEFQHDGVTCFRLLDASGQRIPNI